MTARATILGVGEADGGTRTGRRGVELAAEAALRALDDAGLALDDVDGLIVEDPDTDQHHMPHLAVADTLGWRPAYATAIANGGATPFASVGLATAVLDSGQADRLLLIDYDARQTERPSGTWQRMTRRSGHKNPWEDPYGPTTMAKFALMQRLHMERFGTTREQLAHITVSARANGAIRPRAQMRRRVTLDEVLDSAPIAEPIHLLDCCLVSDWGSAVVISRHQRDAARGVDVLGFGQAHEGYAVTRAIDPPAFPAIQRAGRAAMTMAGISPAEVDVALIYDSFTITVLVALEGLGFCRIGEGGAFVASGAITAEGPLPLNPHGGQLSYSGGHGHFLVEAVRQLRGEAPSAQVSGCDVALCHGTAAGVLSAHTVVLGRR
jgi:acetyl-CoA acetyltransferase